MIHPTATTAELIVDDSTRAVLAEIEHDPLAAVHLVVLAPGGYGKTMLLAELEHTYRAAGLTVVAGRQACAEPIEPEATVVLVDDAHQLSAQQLDELCVLAEQQASRMVVACRPWPRPAELNTLTELLTRRRAPVLLTPFDQRQTAAQLTAVLGNESGTAFAERVQASTGGVPRFVDRIATALDQPAPADSKTSPASSASPGERREFELPAGALSPFGYDFDRLDADVLRFLFAEEAGVGRQLDLLGALLGRDGDGVATVLEMAKASGLLGSDGALLPIAAAALNSLNPAEGRLAVRARLARLQLERGGPVLELVRSLPRGPGGGVALAAAYEAAAGEALPADPGLAAEMYGAAVESGTPLASVAVRWANAAALAGDLPAALRLTDQVIAGPTTPDQADGALIAATALVHLGQLGSAAELYRWSGAGSATAFASICLLGTGALDDATELFAAPGKDGPPTLLASAASLMAKGILESVTGSPRAALAALVRAAALLEPAGRSVLLPDSPAALAALVALHCGELAIAESVLDRAVAANVGGALMLARHRLLQAWISMMRGAFTAAREYLGLANDASSAYQPRDWLYAVGIEVGLARRASDLAALRRIWSQAGDAVMRHPIDLYTFLPLGEFAIAAARLRDQDRLAPHVQEAKLLSEQLHQPPLWTTALHWSGLHAAIIGEQPAQAEEHVHALAEGAGHSRYGAVLYSAARCWLAVINGAVHPAAVEAAARQLDEVGLSWDGARLAGQAAIRTADRKAMVRLLECARLLQGKTHPKPGSKAPSATPSGSGSGSAAEVIAAGKLSEREWEVAGLVLAGLTYKQIGDRLFISAKTVEHHVARMRQRLGATSRSDLLAQLRLLASERGAP
ncbi:MAG TPA: helix-turn-helix transcriptional regulator [Pseudonocardiaceae bacterium]|nr:helix-turn-helix transcriptional regulator [Pseudonocardiaceae bacterium]